MLIGTIRSDPITVGQGTQSMETGQIEYKVRLDRAQRNAYENSANKRKFLFQHLAFTLGVMIEDTQLPRDHWYVVFPEWMIKAFDLPAQSRFAPTWGHQ